MIQNSKTDKKKLHEKSVNASIRGDEIVIARYKAGKPAGLASYIARGNDRFSPLTIENRPDGGQNAFIREGTASINGAVLLSKIEKNEDQIDSRPFWNRRKFKDEEVTKLEQGKVLSDYKEITREYNPMKILANQKNVVMNALQKASVGTEIVYQRYYNGRPSGLDSYVCTERGKFSKIYRRWDENHENRMIWTKSGSYDTGMILDTMPTTMNALPANGNVDIKEKRNKYTRDEVRQMTKENMILNDTEIEARRRMWLRTDKVYEQVHGSDRQVIEYWKDKISGKTLHTRELYLTEEAIQKIKDRGLMLSDEKQVETGIRRKENGEQSLGR